MILDRPCLSDALRRLGASLPLAEPPEAALAAEAWRQAWRPEHLRVLLLAESHMGTTREEVACSVTVPPSVDWPCPAGFVRHVYCAGYGEAETVAGATRRNLGCPQYWRMLCHADATGAPAWPGMAKAGTRLLPRLRTRAALLHRLRNRGIWLTDASLVAVAHPGGRREAGRIRAAALQESWRLYHGHLLPALRPEHVVVIGHSVAQVLGPQLDAAFGGRWTAVPQPNGARWVPRQTEAMHATLTDRCSRFAPRLTGD